MKHTNRNRVHFFIVSFLLISTAVSGCILVVEEDRGRRGHLYGTEWYLEISFYGVRSIAAPDQSVELSFVDESRFEGVSTCGVFSGAYSLTDQDEFSIGSLTLDGDTCESNEASSVFLSQLEQARQLVHEDGTLRINTGRGDYLMFLEK